MKTPHNPQNLTDREVGEGYYLLCIGDITQDGDEVWKSNFPNWFPMLHRTILTEDHASFRRRKLPVSTTGTKHDSDQKAIHGDKKPQLHMIPPAASEAMARALELGARKYGERNWIESQVEYTTYHSAMRRHLDAIMDGEDLDPESTIHHLGHVMASAAIVLDAMRHGTLIDNRVLPNGKKL